jgi:hypothetical protein
MIDPGKPKYPIPSEAAAIIASMILTPPKHLEEMKLGTLRGKIGPENKPPSVGVPK